MTTNLARWRPSVLAPFDVSALFAPEIRIEQVVDGDRYTVRAEIPGADPEKEVTVAVVDGLLKIIVERSGELKDKAHSQFHYGRFVRTVALPAATMQDTATATYTNGILEIGFKLGEPKQPEHRIAIEVPKPEGGKSKE